jgi:hypothetical protein
MLIPSIVLSAVLIGLSLVVAARAKKPPRTYWLSWVGLIPAVIPCIWLLPAYLLHAVSLGVLATVASIGHFPRWIFVAGSLLIAPMIYLSLLLPAWRQVQESLVMYPQESVEERLAYEGNSHPEAGQRHPQQIDDEQIYSSQFIGQPELRRRFYALQALHDNTYELFINSAGLGVARMGRYGPNEIREADFIRVASPVGMPQPSPEGYSPPITASDAILGKEPSARRADIAELHTASLGDFLNPLGFGYVKNRQRVTGFLAHRFTKYPQYAERQGGWRIDSLDLISILKHKEPVANVSKHLPRMDELRAAPTRPLDDFESERLVKLRSGETLSAAERPRRLRMLGAIRAQDICLNCHSAKVDDLLGAFSYDLRLDWPDDLK